MAVEQPEYGPLSGFESVQGRRQAMEDTHVALDDVRTAFPSSAKEKVSYFAVYDGHGGAQIADLCEKMVHKNIITDESFAKGDFETAIKNGFANTDKDLLKAAADANWHSGACVVSTIISKRKLWLGNLGDSEAILARREGTGYKAIELSHKHKPTDPIEKERIKKVGGYVVLGRVMGSLAVARALGDKDFKKPFNNSEGDYVSAEPHLNQIDLTPEDEFLIVSCDGLWDRMSYDHAIQLINKLRGELKGPTEVAQLVVKEALEKGTMDNVTCIIIYLTAPKAAPKKDLDVYEFLKVESDKKKEAAEKAEKSRFDAIQPVFDLPHEEKLLEELTCTLEKKGTWSGTMYITTNYACFSGQISKKKQSQAIKIPIRQIQSIEKQKTKFVLSSLRVTTQDGEKYVFTWSGGSSQRDMVFKRLLELLDNIGSAPEVKHDEVEDNSVSSPLSKSDPPSNPTSPKSDEESNLKFTRFSRFDED